VFVRKKRNKSGSVSVQIIEKKEGRYKVVRTVGSSDDPNDIERFVLEGQQIIHAPKPGEQWLLPLKSPQELAIENFVANLSNAQIHTIGPELIFGTLFDRMGFNAIPEELFRHLIIARLVYPVSKIKTIDYLYRYQGRELSVYDIYRFMDKLNHGYKGEVEAISYRHTQKRLGTISIVFYDMTTLYFEAEEEDDLRKIGYSKDGKFQHPQILVGLLVGTEGLPIGYDIFEGNTFEGHTLLPTLKKIQEKYHLGKPIVVADAALLSKKNLELLEQEDYQFIIGARIKNESEDIKSKILTSAKHIQDGEGFVLKKEDGTRLVVTYAQNRAKKDASNRRRGLHKLTLHLGSGRLTKEHINNRGYNKFLKIQGEATVTLDEEKIKADMLWDGLKGYLTNTKLSIKAVAANYKHLWQIEKAFRISKTDLRVRPIYHYRKRRIEAHICIAFVAYAIYKELEHLLQRKGVHLSPKRAAELTQNMYQLEYVLPESGEKKRQHLKMDAEQRLVYEAVHGK
jgi:transposase